MSGRLWAARPGVAERGGVRMRVGCWGWHVGAGAGGGPAGAAGRTLRVMVRRLAWGPRVPGGQEAGREPGLRSAEPRPWCARAVVRAQRRCWQEAPRERPVPASTGPVAPCVVHAVSRNLLVSLNGGWAGSHRQPTCWSAWLEI